MTVLSVTFLFSGIKHLILSTASIISTVHTSSASRLDRGASRSSSFRFSSYASERSDSHFSENMGSILGYIDDPGVINLESTKMVTPVTCVGSQFLLLSDTLFSYGGGEKASSTYYTYTGYGSVLNVGSIKASPMTMHAAVAYGSYYLCHGGCSDLRTFRKSLLSPHKIMVINSVTLAAHKKKISGNVPSARLSHRMYLIKPHTVFLAGGLGATGFCKDCFLINLLSMESTYAGELPLPLGNFSIVECNSQVYLIGGQTDGFIVLPVFYKIVFTDKHGQTGEVDANQSSSVAGSAQAAGNITKENAASFYNTGWSERNVEKKEHIPDDLPLRISFEKLPDPPFLPRRGHTCVSIGKYILLFGGTTGTRYFNDFWLYDSVSLQWREINIYGDPPSKRYGAMMGFLDTSIIVAGGSNGIMQLHDAFYINANELINQKG